VKLIVDELRKKGIKAGLLKPIFFRPFPKERIARSLSKVKVAGILDRAESFSAMGGPLFNEIRSAMYDSPSRPLTANYIYGLGGRDIYPKDIENIINNLVEMNKKGKADNLINYIGVRD
jgi:pyruvate ferredoxin oxidoreductase alpha subunit